MLGQIWSLVFAWGVCGIVVYFWYYVMSRIGSF